MLKQRINLSFKDKIEEDLGLQPVALGLQPVALIDVGMTPTGVAPGTIPDEGGSDDVKIKNCWSGYHVRFRNPRNYQEYAIDKKFNRWGDMVDFFSQQERPYKLSQGSLKDLLYGTYKRKGMHSLSLNDLVTIEKIDRTRIIKPGEAPQQDNLEQTEERVQELEVVIGQEHGNLLVSNC